MASSDRTMPIDPSILGIMYSIINNVRHSTEPIYFIFETYTDSPSPILHPLGKVLEQVYFDLPPCPLVRKMHLLWSSVITILKDLEQTNVERYNTLKKILFQGNGHITDTTFKEQIPWLTHTRVLQRLAVFKKYYSRFSLYVQKARKSIRHAESILMAFPQGYALRLRTEKVLNDVKPLVSFHWFIRMESQTAHAIDTTYYHLQSLLDLDAFSEPLNKQAWIDSWLHADQTSPSGEPPALECQLCFENVESLSSVGKECTCVQQNACKKCLLTHAYEESKGLQTPYTRCPWCRTAVLIHTMLHV